MTAERLLEVDMPDKRVELVRGLLVVSEPPGLPHGIVAMELGIRIGSFVKANGLGVTVAAETGFTLFRNPDTVRAPDVAFIRSARLPNPVPRGYAEFAPDLCVEVLSPDDRPGKVLAKISDWLEAGCRLVWIIDPERRTARVYRADGSEALLTEADSLEGEDLLPGLSISLNEIFVQ